MLNEVENEIYRFFKVSSVFYLALSTHFERVKIQRSPLNSNCWGPTKFVLIMRCSNYEFALHIKFYTLYLRAQQGP